MDTLTKFGWTPELTEAWAELGAENLHPARVVADFGTSLKIALPDIRTAELSGKLAHYTNRDDTPKVGDWVAVQLFDNSPAVIEGVLRRRNEIARKVAGKRTTKQIIAANIDIAFVLLALDDDFSVERLRRFLYQLSIHAIRPVIVLNKADKTDDLAFYTQQLEEFKLPTIISTATTGSGIETILSHIRPGMTAILLGSSGVGKSTITNKLLGREAQPTQEVRASDSTGKHTTVHRELFMLPNGGLLIDTPGIRELQLWGDEGDLAENFNDIAVLARRCKYASCSHTTEEGCAVQQALQAGILSESHYASYQKMKRELESLKDKKDAKARHNNRRSSKVIADQTKDALREMREDI
nr:ribosome small subunit-dependent GTPase A [uncultured bacterium]AIA14485.1 ribosome small subunit-dependent GTPase A [uncultured bacterium]